MKLRFTRRAALQIEAVLDEIAAESPQGARNVQERLLTVLSVLRSYPSAGRITSKLGVRRIVVSPYPYVIDYSSDADEIIVRRFRHAARRPLA